MSFEFFLLVNVVIIFGYQLLKYRRKLQQSQIGHAVLDAVLYEQRTTLRSGLYQRFKETHEGEKENPFAFETFVADIVASLNGSEVYVTRDSGEYDVDLEESRDERLYLYQVNCWKKPVGLESIAIIHSQMIKEKADGAYVLTTGTFTPEAIAYAGELDIVLMDGDRLLDMWITHLETKKELASQVLPEAI